MMLLPSALSPTWAENEILHLVYRHHALNHEPDCYSVLDSDPGPVLDANSSRIRSGPTVNSYFANAPYSDSGHTFDFDLNLVLNFMLSGVAYRYCSLSRLHFDSITSYCSETTKPKQMAQGKPDCWRGDACRGDELPPYTRPPGRIALVQGTLGPSQSDLNSKDCRKSDKTWHNKGIVEFWDSRQRDTERHTPQRSISIPRIRFRYETLYRTGYGGTVIMRIRTSHSRVISNGRLSLWIYRPTDKQSDGHGQTIRDPCWLRIPKKTAISYGTGGDQIMTYSTDLDIEVFTTDNRGSSPYDGVVRLSELMGMGSSPMHDCIFFNCT
ncbi:hypothetical protein EVAR_98722_1 [Eumeta japonica]|uniref:Uncharacterized protein n=1 Tax=Eumeta variegata TaxID=151549 RepID=A0A4C1ZMR2_EUMVA|nr:hypothetical protein EVAR_98722_1 [Eumeta japonica]